MASSEGAPIESKEWTLDPETEYRFELDPDTSLAVKVRHSDTPRAIWGMTSSA
jgi:hypothetical protein